MFCVGIMSFLFGKNFLGVYNENINHLGECKMSIELAISLILLFVIIYVFLINIYSILFRLTGLTKTKARFQAISLLTNSGYTTSEAEIITTNHVRRNIAIASMITGYVFSVVIVSLVFNLIKTLSTQELGNNYISILIAFGVFVGVLILFKLPFIKKPCEKAIEGLAKRIMKRNVKDNIITVIDNYGKVVMSEILLNFLPEEINGKRLSEINSRDTYHINFLILKRKGVAQTVDKDTTFEAGDTVVVFGALQNIKQLFIINKKNVKEEKD